MQLKHLVPNKFNALEEDNNHYFFPSHSNINFQGKKVEVPVHVQGKSYGSKGLSTYALLHQHWFHTPLYGTGNHLLQHHSHQPANKQQLCNIIIIIIYDSSFEEN